MSGIQTLKPNYWVRSKFAKHASKLSGGVMGLNQTSQGHDRTRQSRAKARKRTGTCSLLDGEGSREGAKP
jgi:hypothetical protein